MQCGRDKKRKRAKEKTEPEIENHEKSSG